ncbi:hypothetical protein LCGC14_2003080 [marine sediment metagenome]|uniref:Uncharacterized protein n=1 Tax=marine sediment metagenome TaxID=412755 RepID=A0A0F9F2L7_9ZZZZ
MGLGMGLKGYVFGFLDELERRAIKFVTVFEKAAVQTTAGVVDAADAITSIVTANELARADFIGYDP